MAQKKNYRALTFAVMVAALMLALALSTLAADIKGGFGKIEGDVAGYQAASVTLGAEGQKEISSTVIDLDTANTGLAGIYAIRAGEDSEWEENLIFVYGSYEARGKLGTMADGVPASHEDATVTPLWAAGTYLGEPWNASKGRFQHASGWRWKIAASYSNGVNDLKAAYQDWEAAKAAYDTAKDAYDADSSESNADALTAAEEALDAKTSTLRTIQGNYKTNLQKISMRYAYNPDEIIPIGEVETMVFQIGSQYNVAGLPGWKPVIELYIMDEKGDVKVCSYTGSDKSYAEAYIMQADSVSVQNIEGIKTSGKWLVGFKYSPYSVIDETTMIGRNATGGGFLCQSPVFKVPCEAVTNSYVISKPKYDAPKVSLNGSKIVGLDETKTYEIASYFITGVGEVLEESVTGITEYDLDEGAVGLYAVKVLGGDEAGDSEYSLVYVKGSFEARQKLGTMENGVPKATFNHDKEWEVGSYLGNDWYNNLFFKNGGWSRKLADLNALNAAYLAWREESNKINPDPEALKEKRAAWDAYKPDMKSKLESVKMSYAYNADEIIPISEVKEMKFHATKQTNHTGVITVKPIVELYVMNANGELAKYTYDKTVVRVHETVDPFAVDVQSIDGIPSEGWLVGFRYYPFGSVLNVDEFVGVSGATGFQNYINDRCKIPCEKFNGYYTITELPAYATKPSFKIDGLTITSGLSADKTYVFNPVTLGDFGGMIALGAPITVANATTYTFEKGGLYTALVKGSDTYADSGKIMFYVKDPDAEGRRVLTEANESNTLVTNSEKFFVAGSVSGLGTTLTLGQIGSLVISDKLYGARSWGDLNVNDLHNAETEEAKKAAYNVLAKEAEGRSIKYALTSEEIIPIKDVYSYTFCVPFDNNSNVKNFVFANTTVRFIAYVMGDDGRISKYYTDFSGLTRAVDAKDMYTVDFEDDTIWKDVGNNAAVIPDNGYFVGFEVLPYYHVGNYEDLVYVKGDSLGANNTYMRTYFLSYYFDSIYVTADVDLGVSAPVQNLILEDKIGIQIKVNYTAETVPEIKLVTEDKTYVATLDNGVASIVIPVAPKDYKDVFTGDLYYGYAIIAKDISLSVESYIDSLLDTDISDETRALVTALEDYCEYTANYFDKDAEALGEIALTTDEMTEIRDFAPTKVDNNIASVGLEFYSTSLILEGETTLRHYFKVIDEEAYANADFGESLKELDGESSKSDAKYVYVEKKNIGASNLSSKMTLTVTDSVSGASIEISFAATDYVKLAISDSNVKLQNLVKALYRYSKAADAYKAFVDSNN